MCDLCRLYVYRDLVEALYTKNRNRWDIDGLEFLVRVQAVAERIARRQFRVEDGRPARPTLASQETGAERADNH